MCRNVHGGQAWVLPRQVELPPEPQFQPEPRVPVVEEEPPPPPPLRVIEPEPARVAPPTPGGVPAGAKPLRWSRAAMDRLSRFLPRSPPISLSPRFRLPTDFRR